MDKCNGAFLEDVKRDWEFQRKIDAMSFPRLLKLAEKGGRLQAELAKHRWIPVSERLPKKSGDYLTMIKYTHTIKTAPVVDMYSTQDCMWGSGHPHTHWKPIILPEQASQDESCRD